MPIRTLRPTNNGSRHQALLTTDGLSKVAPEKALLTTLKKMVEETTRDTSLVVIRVVVINKSIVSSISRDLSSMV